MLTSVLFIDDDGSILDSLPAALTKRLNCLFAASYDEALAVLRERPDCPVVVTELGVKGKDSLEFLRTLRTKYPRTTRLILTGRGNYSQAMKAINEGEVYRFLEKPCPQEKLTQAISDAIRVKEKQPDSQKAVRKALMGSIKALMDVLDLVHPEAVGVSRRIRERVISAAKAFGVKSIWRMEMAILLSHVGCVALPSELLVKVDTGKPLTPEERQMFAMHPKIAFNLLSNIDQLTSIALILKKQLQPLEKNPPLESRILKIAIAIDRLERKGADIRSALRALGKQPEEYDPMIIKHMSSLIIGANALPSIEVSVENLEEGMIMADDLINKDGVKLLLRGQRISKASLIRLKSFHIALGILDPVHVVDATKTGDRDTASNTCKGLPEQ